MEVERVVGLVNRAPLGEGGWLANNIVKHRIDDLELPAVHPKKAFIVGIIDKEIRLSFAQRIKGTLPEPYQYLISEGKEKDTPEFKYFSDSMCKFSLGSNMQP